ncbi:hypothetical protein ACEQ8H_002968 [Pleosporales sp. CAS-2024a]
MPAESNVVDVLTALSSINASTVTNDLNERTKALALSKQLTAALESPIDRAINCIFQPFDSASIRMAVGLKLFDHLCTASGDLSSKQLSQLSGGDEILISRILRIVAAAKFVNQTGPSTWRANEITKVVALPPISAGYRCDMLTRTAMYGTKFLEETGWKNPSEPRDGFFQYANHTKLHLFDYLATQPELGADFNMFMGAVGGSQSYWWDWYDIKGRLIDGFDKTKSNVMLVDIGGGNGHDIQMFHEQFGAHHCGALVLQDMASVIAGIPSDQLDNKITRMGHDFFQEQPIKGARTYYLHHILHDWSDKYCLQILAQLRSAMTPGYSKLVIHDLVLPDVGATDVQARFDMAMMTINSGMERSKLQFTQLLESAGFKVTTIFTWLDKDGIVEAEVVIGD